MENTELLHGGAEGAGQETGVTGEDLFRAYQEGKSIDELKGMFSSSESEEETETDSYVTGEEPEDDGGVDQTDEDPEEPEEQDEPKEEKPTPKPYVFESQEAYQRHFDRAFGKRHAETLSQLSEQKKTIDEISGLLANVLGVSKEKAFDELRSRHYAVEAEEKGYDNPEQYAALKQAENRIADLEKQAQKRIVDEQIADIRRQGTDLSQKIKGFDLDSAMENEMFRQTVFTLQKQGATDSVERAFKAVFFDEFLKSGQPARTKEPVRRPKEGAVSPKTNTAVKNSNVSSFSGAQIRDLEKRILRGEKIEF